MCGIVGLIAKAANGFTVNDDDIFTNMLRMDTIRGKDSTGVFGVTSDGEVDIVKANASGWDFTKCKQYGDFERKIYNTYKIVIGHNRAATRGSVTPHNAHPFREENIVLVHNGTIHNQHELNTDVDVDSHAIAHALAAEDATKALNMLNGAFALVWYDTKQKTLNLARNNERPLFILEYDHVYAIASEPGLPHWLFGREGTGPKKDGMQIIPTERIFQINLDNIREGFKEIKYENYKYVAPVLPIPVFQNTNNRPLHLPRPSNTSSQLATAGDRITFKIDDVKHDKELNKFTIFGFPLIDNEIHETILVKTDLVSERDAELLIANDFLQGTITAVMTMGNMPLWFVKYPVRVSIKQDANNNQVNTGDIAEVLAQGCGRCKKRMFEVDIPESIIRKKKDGTYRTLCKTCLSTAIDEVRQERKLAS